MFLDNVSVGFYAAMVRDPDYRRRRVRVAARYARRALLGGGRRASLCMPVPRGVVASEQLLVALVPNNAYFPGVAPGPALRPGLDGGMLWVYLMGLPGARRPLAARVVRGTGWLISGRALVAERPTSKQIMTTDTPSIPVGVDGEPAELQPPLEFRSLTPRVAAAATGSERAGGSAVLPPVVISTNAGTWRSRRSRARSPDCHAFWRLWACVARFLGQPPGGGDLACYLL